MLISGNVQATALDQLAQSWNASADWAVNVLPVLEKFFVRQSGFFRNAIDQFDHLSALFGFEIFSILIWITSIQFPSARTTKSYGSEFRETMKALIVARRIALGGMMAALVFLPNPSAAEQPKPHHAALEVL